MFGVTKALENAYFDFFTHRYTDRNGVRREVLLDETRIPLILARRGGKALLRLGRKSSAALLKHGVRAAKASANWAGEQIQAGAKALAKQSKKTLPDLTKVALGLHDSAAKPALAMA